MEVGFYVTMIRGEQNPRVAYLAGPFPTHEEALAQVEPAKQLASKLDPWSDFDSFGTCKLSPPVRVGVLNEKLNLWQL